MTDVKSGAQLHEEQLTKQKIIKDAMRDLELRKWCLELTQKRNPFGNQDQFIEFADAIYVFVTKD